MFSQKNGEITMITNTTQTLKVVQEESKVQFDIKNAGFLVKGSLSDLDAKINFDKANPEDSFFEASVKVSTINTNNFLRDAHLKQSDYFWVSEHPLITFQSDTVEKTKEGFLATGQLKIKGISQKVSLPFQVRHKGRQIVFQGNLTLNRLDYKIGSRSFILDNKVKIDIICTTEVEPS